MTILLQIDIFYLILENLSLKEAIRLRAVCSQWKEWIDAHLKRQKVLLLEDHDCYFHTNLSVVSQTLDINYARMENSKLVIRERNFGLESFGSSLVRTFPNLEELYIFVSPYNNYYRTIEYGTFILGLKATLKKLVVDHFHEEHAYSFEGYPPGLFESLAECEKRVTFGVRHWLEFGNACLSGEDFMANFLERLTSLWFPSYQLLNSEDVFAAVTALPSITGVANNNSHNSYHLNRISKRKFPNLERIFIKVELFPDSQNDKIFQLLEKLAELEHENLNCLEMEFGKNFGYWPDKVEFKDSVFLPFSDHLNRIPGVKTLKIGAQHAVLMEYILRNCSQFNYIETLIINFVTVYRSSKPEKIDLPTNFEELLPNEMNRIKNLEIHADKRIVETLKKMNFSRLPYKVKVCHIY